MSETCLVTGGAGFIGSWLCKSLVEKGYNVIGIDNLLTGSEENLKPLRDKENFTFLRHDITQKPDIKENIDYIFHLASPASPVDYQNHPIETMLANSLGTFNTLELAKEKNSRFLLASTSEVYGDPQEHPQKESYWGHVNPTGPRACYDESKRFSEALAISYLRKHGLDIRIVRIFNTYGPGMKSNDGRVIPNFITQALRGEPITVYGDGKQSRSFCYITDMVEALEKVMFTDGLAGEVFNIGNPDEISVLDAANTIKNLASSSSEIVFKPLPQDDPARRRPDITKIREKLGWEPKTGFEEGLRKTIEHFRNRV